MTITRGFAVNPATIPPPHRARRARRGVSALLRLGVGVAGLGVGVSLTSLMGKLSLCRLIALGPGLGQMLWLRRRLWFSAVSLLGPLGFRIAYLSLALAQA